MRRTQLSSPLGEIIKLLRTNMLLLCSSSKQLQVNVWQWLSGMSQPCPSQMCEFTLDFISKGSLSVWGYIHSYSSSRLIQFMTPEAESHHDQRSGAFCDGTGPYFAQHFLLHLVQLASVIPHLPKQPFHAGKCGGTRPWKVPTSMWSCAPSP